jgi:hypothetical protein
MFPSGVDYLFTLGPGRSGAGCSLPVIKGA